MLIYNRNIAIALAVAKGPKPSTLSAIMKSRDIDD
jgi:hypothetical protein